jgi:hypothetical protein
MDTLAKISGNQVNISTDSLFMDTSSIITVDGRGLNLPYVVPGVGNCNSPYSAGGGHGGTAITFCFCF